jgi:FkbM family methyltransferase
MTLRGHLKRLRYGLTFGRGAKFPYFGTTVFFPKNSMIFQLACDQGIYELALTRSVNNMIRAGTTYFDVGANIGLLSVPALATRPDCRVVSIEASPTTLQYLRRTHAASEYKARWTIVGEGVADICGKATFYESIPERGAMDGFRDTDRSGERRPVSVPVTTIDTIWGKLGYPETSVIKLDIEGGEMAALKGGEQCLRANRPLVFLEWNVENLDAYGINHCEILQFARANDFRLLSIPHFVEILHGIDLKLLMDETQTFALIPAIL